MADKPAPKSAKEIEAELQASRQRLAGTIDELAFRAQPREIAKRQVETVKLKASEATRTPEGDVAGDKLGIAVGGLGAVLLALGLIRRARG
ncbi:DUF3618 domain-containing protein [Yimella sp. cx-51]|uniref:DUF3618 domain-containing protein n=1 Tax=Yimella sp. cx-51 TaxID=2770551 RepID=UPI00165E3630|nr:DUF3618 domain-containing protein [Yimella sp. cx-51]MBC9957102.1 DUF3618 domain-containing protein [Yimella sp. cx-51]MBD2758411.1 DUF3618 domain-containing protein [Yimella sp. cx-573]QTH37241.1 DUF3618 domain-containing protein [Yimella sp. cx-51]